MIVHIHGYGEMFTCHCTAKLFYSPEIRNVRECDHSYTTYRSHFSSSCDGILTIWKSPEFLEGDFPLIVQQCV